MWKQVVSFVLLIQVSMCLLSFSWEDRVQMETDVTPTMPLGWANLGPVDSDETIELLIALSHQNIHTLERIILDVSMPKSTNYGKYLTVSEVSDLITPKPISFTLVKSWLSRNNIENFHLIGNDWVKVITSIANAENLLKIQYNKFIHIDSGYIVYRSLDSYSVPKVIAEHIDFVGGVFRFPTFPKIFERNTQDVAAPTTPESIQQMYKISDLTNSTTNLQAVASFLFQYFSPADLASFESANSLPNVPIAYVYGPNKENLPGVEASLDVQYLVGVPNTTVETWVISTSGTTNAGNEPFLVFLSNLANLTQIPYLISMSYQDYEYTVGQSYAERCSEEFMKYSVTGTTFITGSGDWGVGCSEPDHCDYFVADFPSSSPYVISTGATTLSPSGEIGVAFSSGGFSNYFAMPSFQQDVVEAFLSQSVLPPSSFFNASGRAFPDVAAIGTDFQVFVNGNERSVGGTSASTPTFGSVLSLINSELLANNKCTLGWALPFLYQAYRDNKATYNDILNSEPQQAGCCMNSFNTVPGWDPYTGLGTPNYQELLKYALSYNTCNN